MTYVPSDFGLDKSGPQFTWLESRLTAHGFGSVRLLDDLKERVQRFQLKQGWTGSGADGLMGPKTLERLTADPKPLLPADILDLSRWKLQTSNDDGSAIDVKQPALNEFVDLRRFCVAGSGVMFRQFADGGTTSGSSYPRTELRERVNGVDASWDTSDGKLHRVRASLLIGHLPIGEACVVGQFHDAADDLVMLKVTRTSSTTGRVDASWSKGKDQGSTVEPLDLNHSLGARFDYQLSAQNGLVEVLYKDHRSSTWTASRKSVGSRSGCYGKAGVYNQFNESDAPSVEFASAIFYELEAA